MSKQKQLSFTPTRGQVMSRQVKLPSTVSQDIMRSVEAVSHQSTLRPLDLTDVSLTKTFLSIYITVNSRSVTQSAG